MTIEVWGQRLDETWYRLNEFRGDNCTVIGNQDERDRARLLAKADHHKAFWQTIYPHDWIVVTDGKTLPKRHCIEDESTPTEETVP